MKVKKIYLHTFHGQLRNNIQRRYKKRVDHIIWLPQIEEKLLRKHRVLVEEVEEVFFSSPQIFFVERGYTSGENLYAACGKTEASRSLIIFFILKSDNRALVISARDMDRKEKKRYGKKAS